MLADLGFSRERERWCLRSRDLERRVDFDLCPSSLSLPRSLSLSLLLCLSFSLSLLLCLSSERAPFAWPFLSICFSR